MNDAEAQALLDALRKYFLEYPDEDAVTMTCDDLMVDLENSL